LVGAVLALAAIARSETRTKAWTPRWLQTPSVPWALRR